MKPLTKKERADLALLFNHVTGVLLAGYPPRPTDEVLARLGVRLRRSLMLVHRLAGDQATPVSHHNLEQAGAGE